MQRNSMSAKTDSPVISNRPKLVHPFPQEITEHPAWRAIWRKLLSPSVGAPMAPKRLRDDEAA